MPPQEPSSLKTRPIPDSVGEGTNKKHDLHQQANKILGIPYIPHVPTEVQIEVMPT